MRPNVLGGGVALGCPVDRGRGREHDSHPVARGGFEDPLRRELVATEVEREDVAEAAHAGLAREMEEPVEAGEVERVLGQVEALHVEPASVLLLQRRRRSSP